MMPTRNLSKPGCIECTLKIVGDKWTPLILRDLTAGSACFVTLEKSLVGISPRTLSQRLSKLKAENIVEKQLYNEHPRRYHYALTHKGKELQAVLEQMATWGARYS